MKDYFILMADIVDSRRSDQNKLMSNFKKVISETNHENEKLMLSPLTITLGDEFQGIVNNAKAAVKLMFFIEEKIIRLNAGFKLRFVLVEGVIDTPINKKIAYEMLGDGLTQAREALTTHKNSNVRYCFNLKNEPKSEALVNSMFLYQSIVDDWKVSKDYDLITKFIKLRDYKLVAEELGKTRSQIWKREKSLKIEEYFSIKSVINYISELP
ncbi:SatD family protein [Pedobacter sp. P26]|uniref:SatD family protein n=1 Tax=Pedobacter sp. P26 TaxID=3423956 RepID=UPI003D66C91E